MTIHPHSQTEKFFIFCVGQSLYQIKAFAAAMAYAQIPAKPLLGKYKGTSEQSFISLVSDFEHIKPWLGKEESILLIHSFDARDVPKATLKYLSCGTEQYLGRFKPVPREVAVGQENYTYDPTYDNYFICQCEHDQIAAASRSMHEAQPLVECTHLGQG